MKQSALHLHDLTGSSGCTLFQRAINSSEDLLKPATEKSNKLPDPVFDHYDQLKPIPPTLCQEHKTVMSEFYNCRIGSSSLLDAVLSSNMLMLSITNSPFVKSNQFSTILMNSEIFAE